jgi:hypothetical protein
VERKIILLSFILFILLINGCGGEGSSSASSTKDGSVVRTDFSPAEPTSSDAIVLRITAVTKEAPDYNWVVNGIPVSVSGNKLSPEHFSKNDTVFCSILIVGKEMKKVGPIIIKNSPPAINSVEISPSSPRHGTDLTLNADADDADDDDVILHVRWFVNEEVVSTDEVLSGSRIKAEDKVYAVVTPYDGTDEGKPVNSGLIVIQNSPPKFTSGPPLIEGRTMNAEIKVEDVDGDKFDLSLEESPPGMRIEDGRLLWKAPDLHKDTSFVVKIKARDERGGETTVSFSLDLRESEMQ